MHIVCTIDLFLHPDITKTVFLAHETSVTGGAFPTKSNLHASSEKFSLFADTNAFNVTMIQCGESPYSQLMSTTDSLYSQIKTDSDTYDPKQDTTSRQQQQQLSPSCSTHAQRKFAFKLPCNVDANSISWARFTPSGGRLTIPESGKETVSQSVSKSINLFAVLSEALVITKADQWRLHMLLLNNVNCREHSEYNVNQSTWCYIGLKRRCKAINCCRNEGC